MGKLRMMSNNVWNCDTNKPAWEAKGEDCSSAARMKGFVRVYRETSPDIIGGQEFSMKNYDELLRGLEADGQKYAALWGRSTPIIYRQDKLELIDSDYIPYPNTIDGIEGEFNPTKSKSCCAAVFRDKSDGKVFVFASTHLWWMEGNPESPDYRAGSDEARVFQLNLAMDRIDALAEKYGCPIVLVGDMNANYNSPAIHSAFARGYVHAHDTAVEYADDSMGYHFCFPEGYHNYYYDNPFEDAIDHILVKGAGDGFVRRFERYSPEYYFPLSDHSPVFIDAEL